MVTHKAVCVDNTLETLLSLVERIQKGLVIIIIVEMYGFN